MILPFENKQVEVTIEGSRSYGEDVVLVHHHDNLIAQTTWSNEGYTIAPFLKMEDEFVVFTDGLKEIFKRGIRAAGIAITPDFQVEHYHHLVKDNHPLHLKVINYTKLRPLDEFPIEVTEVVERISEIVGIPLQAYNPNTKEKEFHLRIIRPNHSDFNPLHRDVWQEEWRDGLNIYVPVAGSNASSSLPLVPGSHLWPESAVEHTIQGAIMNGAQYNVPGLTGTLKPLNLIRPNPGLNEVLVFSPYLIHGGGANLNLDQTRVSLEMRFWRK